MPRIIADADNLDQRNAEFVQTPLATPVFMNSVPKCGTHLARNILRMFVPLDQHYSQEFIQIAVLKQHIASMYK